MPTLNEGIYKMKEVLLQRHTNAVKDKYYLPLTGKVSTQQTSIDLKLLTSQFLNGQAKVLLLQGSAGIGKTLFCYHLIVQLLESKEPNDVIPLYIALKPEHSKNKNLIASMLQEQGFSPEQITELQKTQRFLFVFDDFDSLRCFQNIYINYHLDQWQAKVIVTCRPESFINTNDYRSCFVPYQNQKPQPRLLQEISIKTLTNEQIEIYLKHYSAVNIFQSFSPQLSFLKTLAKNPLFLKIIVDVISKLSLQEDKDEKQADRNLYFDILHSILDHWFGYHEDKLKNSGLWDKNDKTLKQQMWDFSIEFAQEMQKQNVIRIVYKPVSKLFPAKQDVSLKFFDDTNPKMKLLRTACPLLKTGTDQYSFIHADIFNYLATQKSLDGISANAIQEQKTQVNNMPSVISRSIKTSNNLLNHYLNLKLLTQDSGRIQFLADRVWEREAFKNELFVLLFASKQTEQVAVGAANAITILNQAKAVFSGMDLRGIRVPNADLKEAIFDSTDLREADLRNINLQGSWLRRTNFCGAYMDDVHFGELPQLTLPAEYPSFVECRACAYSPDGQWLAIDGGDFNRDSKCKIYVYDTHTYQLKYTLANARQTGKVQEIAFSPNGKIIVCADETAVYLWDAVSQAITHTLNWPTQSGKKVTFHRGVAFSPVGQLLAVGGKVYENKEGVVCFWDWEKGTLVHVLTASTSAVWSLAFSISGRLLACGNVDSTIGLWDPEFKVLKRVLSGHQHVVTSVAFSSDEQVLASGSYDNCVRLWNVEQGVLLRVLTKHSYWVTGVTFSPNDGHILASGSKDGTVCLWDIESGKVLQTFIVDSGGRQAGVLFIAFSPDGHNLLSGQVTHIRRWDPYSRKTLSSISLGHKGYVRSIAFSLSGRVIASGGEDGIYIWDAGSKYRALIRAFLSAKAGGVNSAAFSPNEKLLASGETKTYDSKNGGSVNLWDLQKKTLERTLSAPMDSVDCVSFNSDGQMLAAGGYKNHLGNGVICIWDFKSGRTLQTCNGPIPQIPGIRSIVFSPDGRLLACCGGFDGKIRLMDPFTGGVKHFLTGHIGSITSLVFSPDGRLLAAGGETGVNLWNTEGWTLIDTIQSNKPKSEKFIVSGVTSMAFSSNGQVLVGGNTYGTFFLWNLQNQQGFGELLFPGSGDNVYVCWNDTPAGWFLVTGCGSCVRYWQVFEDHIQLIWTSHVGQFTAADARLNGVSGLSDSNFQLLCQRGADKKAIRSNVSSATRLASSNSGVSNLISTVGSSVFTKSHAANVLPVDTDHSTSKYKDGDPDNLQKATRLSFS